MQASFPVLFPGVPSVRWQLLLCFLLLFPSVLSVPALRCVSLSLVSAFESISEHSHLLLSPSETSLLFLFFDLLNVRYVLVGVLLETHMVPSSVT